MGMGEVNHRALTRDRGGNRHKDREQGQDACQTKGPTGWTMVCPYAWDKASLLQLPPQSPLIQTPRSGFLAPTSVDTACLSETANLLKYETGA